MNFNFKKTLSLLFFGAAMLFSSIVNAQSNIEKSIEEPYNKVSCNVTTSKKNVSTSGCKPSSCRGAQTKFGEAKVISDLRINLIGLKADMEKSNTVKFTTRAYDIHGIIGNTDDESIEIITKEIKIIEKEFSNKTDFKQVALSLPKNKAQQITYLENRLLTLKKYL